MLSIVWGMYGRDKPGKKAVRPKILVRRISLLLLCDVVLAAGEAKWPPFGVFIYAKAGKVPLIMPRPLGVL